MSTKTSYLTATAVALTASLAVAAPAAARTIEITISSNQSAGGLFLTPLLTVLHDGSYDGFDAGSAASAGIEELAEEGNPAVEIGGAAAGFNANVITSPGGFAGAPVIDPGETASIRVNVNAATDRYLSFLSMIIPSNDLFIGNDLATAYELFDGMGNFTNISPIQVTAGQVWDAGTEDNTNLGAAFNAAGGTATDTIGGTIALAGDLGFLFGQNTAAGTTVSSIPGGGQLLATISVAEVPLPAGLPLLFGALGAMGLIRRKRRA